MVDESRRWTRVLGEAVTTRIRLLLPSGADLDVYLVDESAQGVAVDVPPSTQIAVGDEIELVATKSRTGVVRHVQRVGLLIRVGIAIHEPNPAAPVKKSASPNATR